MKSIEQSCRLVVAEQKSMPGNQTEGREGEGGGVWGGWGGGEIERGMER